MFGSFIVFHFKDWSGKNGELLCYLLEHEYWDCFSLSLFSIAFSNLKELALGGDQNVFLHLNGPGGLVGQMGLNSITAFNLASGCSQNKQDHLGGNPKQRGGHPIPLFCLYSQIEVLKQFSKFSKARGHFPVPVLLLFVVKRFLCASPFKVSFQFKLCYQCTDLNKPKTEFIWHLVKIYERNPLAELLALFCSFLFLLFTDFWLLPH